MRNNSNNLTSAITATLEQLEDRKLFALSFGAPTPYTVGDATVASVAPGDFNHDGKVDLAIVVRQSGKTALEWMQGDGTGKLSAPKSLGALTNPEDAVAADFNGDGYDDLAVSVTDGITVFFNNGSGLVQKATTTLTDGVMSLDAVNADADNKAELAVGRFPYAISMYHVDSNGAAVMYEGLQSVTYTTSFAFGDLNGDKVNDMVATTEPWNGSIQAGSVDVFWGNKDAYGKPNGQFSYGPSFGAGTYPTQVAITNLNGATKDDLIFLNEGDTYYQKPGNIQTLLNNGSGAFGSPHQMFVNSRPKMMALGDWGDGKNSNVEADLNNGILVSTSNGDGTFSAQTTINGTFNATGVWKVDLNKDGKPDIVATDNVGKLYTLQNIYNPNLQAEIHGLVFNDANGNGSKDAGEIGIAGRTVWIDVDNDKAIDPDEHWTTTTADGSYAFGNLAAGSYKVREFVPTGWSQTTPTNGYGIGLTLATNQIASGKNFGVRQNVQPTGASIAGTVFNDLDGDGIRDANEGGLSGRTIWIDLDNDKVIDANEAKATTDANGNWKLSGLVAGTYKVRQWLPAGWSQTTPSNGYGISVTVSTNQAVTGKLFGEKMI
jgi:hypothetical protein